VGGVLIADSDIVYVLVILYWCNLPSFFLIKKNGEVYGEIEGHMYPSASCSCRNLHNDLSSSCVIGYTLQGNASGAFGLKSIAWSHGLVGGNLDNSSLLNSLLNCSYAFGTTAATLFCPACIANSVETPQMVDWVSRVWTIDCFSLSVIRVAMTGCCHMTHGLIDEMTTGRDLSSMMALCQLNLGSNVASQGYPNNRSSLLMSVIRNHISL
jgi:hypothetical protein